jgi:hypothetical protein
MVECGITNLASCIPQKFFEFILSILNAPIQSLLNLVYKLLTQPVNIEVFAEVWAVIIFILSLFYGLLLLIAGFRFLISGHSPQKRENAKSYLTNIVIMMLLVQVSFFLYSLILEVAASLTTVIFNMVEDDFFLITVDSFASLGLELIMIIPYLIVLVITLILLTLRYICVSAGVVFFALGIFFYFINPLNQYGRLIINGLFVLIFLPFFYSIIFLTSSKLLEIPAFQDFKILVMIGAFSLIIFATLLLLLFVIIKAATKIAGPVGTVAKVVSYVA